MEVRAKKALGQHFLTDQSIARRIVDALSRASQPSDSQSLADFACTENDAGKVGNVLGQSELGATGLCRDVLEIGPGMGVLTQYLLQREDIDLKAVEVDGESVDYLLTHFPGIQGRLLQADFLRLPMEKVFPGPYRVIGNFPYNISSQIFFKILDDKDRVPELVCMIQKEVAERIAEKPGSKTYGILSVLLQAWYDIEYCFTVGPGAFAPPPKVHSAVIRLTRNSRTTLGCDEKLFKQVVKTAFNQRRKTLRNSLKQLIPQGLRLQSPCTPRGQGEGSPCAATQLTPLSAQCASGQADNQVSINDLLDLRAERLSVEDFIALTRYIAGN